MLRVSRFKSVIAPDPSIGYTKRARGRWGEVVELDGGLILALAVLGHLCYGIPEKNGHIQCHIAMSWRGQKASDLHIFSLGGFLGLLICDRSFLWSVIGYRSCLVFCVCVSLSLSLCRFLLSTSVLFLVVPVSQVGNLVNIFFVLPS